MFQQIAPNEVSSSEGFRIKRTDRNTLMYFEDARHICIEVEPGVGLAIYTTTIRSWILSDDEKIPVAKEERDKVVDRISRAYSFLGQNYLIV